MTTNDLLVMQLQSAQMLFEKFSEDFSAEDARFIPCEKANHLNWLLMHVAVSADRIVSTVEGTTPRFSEAIQSQYDGSSECQANDGMTRADAWKAFVETNERAIACIQNTPESRYTEPNPRGSQMFPTIGSLISILGTHAFWHFGQLTINRSLLNKPRVLK